MKQGSILKPGLGGLLEFMSFLEKEGITSSLYRYSPDALTVFFTLVGVRVEVQFYENAVDFSYFKG